MTMEDTSCFDKEAFIIKTVDDEIRVDELSRQLLQEFHRHLLADGIDQLQAGMLAHGADYFLRDFVIGIKHENIFDERPGLVRQFAGNWYIVSTMEPSATVLGGYLEGIREFYRYLAGRGCISAAFLEKVEQEATDISYYEQRIESFWNITGDGYFAWERECPLKERH